MSKPVHLRLSDLRGFHRLASDATLGLTDLVEAMHHTVIRTPGLFGQSSRGRTRGITGLVYRSVRGITRAAGAGVDALLGMLPPLLADRPSSDEREAVLAALNGVLGDYLLASDNPLAITLQLRHRGTPVAIARDALAANFPAATGRLLVLVHGLCMNDLQWTRKGHDHGRALAQPLGYTPLYVQYNSGLHISTNGREFAGLLDALLREWPVAVDRLLIVGHSMGGLVTRSACDHAQRTGHRWLDLLDGLAFLGTPHSGAPLERAGAWVDYLLDISPWTAPFARLGKIRSAGIRDLRYAHLSDEDWQRAPTSAARARAASPVPLPLPTGVRCYAIAASTQRHAGAPGARVRGDGLVPVDSALGRHRDPQLALAIPEARRWIGYGMGHLDLLSSPAVCEQLQHWLREETRRSR